MWLHVIEMQAKICQPQASTTVLTETKRPVTFICTAYSVHQLSEHGIAEAWFGRVPYLLYTHVCALPAMSYGKFMASPAPRTGLEQASTTSTSPLRHEPLIVIRTEAAQMLFAVY